MVYFRLSSENLIHNLPGFHVHNGSFSKCCLVRGEEADFYLEALLITGHINKQQLVDLNQTNETLYEQLQSRCYTLTV